MVTHGEYCGNCGTYIGFPGVLDLPIACANCDRLYHVAWDGWNRCYVLISEVDFLRVQATRQFADGRSLPP